MRAAIYCRISKDDTGRELGVRRQEKDCRALCDRLGWSVAGVFIDNDLSASRGARRPGYEAMCQGIGAGEFDALVCYHSDRLTRHPIELEALIDLIESSKVTVSTVAAGEYDLSTGSGKMVARILGSTARGEVDRMSERIARKKRELCEAGLPVGGGKRRYGYTRDGMHVVPKEADVIRDTAARLLAGASYRSEVKRLNTAGLVPDCGYWSPQSLRSVLTGHRIVAKATHHGKVVADAQWPAILDEETWLALRSPRRPVGAQGRHLLTGVVVCGRCGMVMYWRKNSGHRPAYSCNQLDRGGCSSCAIVAEPLERYVTEQFEAMLPALAAVASAALAARGTGGGLTVVETEIARLEQQLAGYAAQNLAGELELVEWNVLRAGVRDQLAKARADRTRLLSALSVPAVVGSGDLVADWENEGARNRVLRQLIRVVVRPGRGSVAERVSIRPI